MDGKLLEILACPVCKGELIYYQSQKELICKLDRLAFQIQEGIPIMLEEQARNIPAEEEINNG